MFRKLGLIVFLLCLSLPTLAVNNPYGVHTLARPGGVYDWASSLIGPNGYCKLFFYGISNNTSGPGSGWANAVQASYNRGMNVIIRIGTNMNNGAWDKPVADADGHYTAFAAAVKRVVQGLPRQDGYILYIEVLNEVNSGVEWSNDPDPAEYGRCLVDVHDAIDSIGDSRIKVVTAGLAGGSGFLNQMFTMVPESLWAWDVLASHCYAANTPPELNRHNGYNSDINIDSYQLDTAVAASHGRTGVQVMITETGWMLGDASNSSYPTIDEEIRADYAMRAFRDYWSKWPEVIAVTPFQFRDDGWINFDWVYSGSGTDSLGRPTDAHRQYYDVWNLAKPTMAKGAISGKITESAFGAVVSGATVTLNPGNRMTTSNARGNYFFPNYSDTPFLDPGTYSITVTKTGYSSQSASNKQVTAGQNTVVNFSLTAINLSTLTGTVKDPVTGLGLQGVSISLSPGGRTATTDENGVYTIASLTPSTYTLSSSKYGFRPYSVSNVVTSAGNTTTVDFYLAPGLEPVSGSLMSTGEMDTGANGLCDGWEAYDGQQHSAYYAVDNNERFSGVASQRIKAGGDYWIGEWTNYSACFTGTVYRIEAWVKTSGTTSPARVTGTFSRYGSSTDGWFECYPQMTGTNGWTLYVGRSVAPLFEAGDGAGRLRVELHPPTSGTGYAWFDRVWMGRDPDQSGSPICSVSNFRATAGEGSVTLNWTNPPTSIYPAFSGTMIRRMTDRYPVVPTEGTLVADVNSTATTATDTSVMPGTRYYYTAFTHTAGPSNYSKGSYASAVPTDSTAPSTPSVSDAGTYTTSTTSISASWSASDPQSGIAEYQYAVGTAPYGNDVVDWTSAGTSAQSTIAANLQHGQTYYVSVKAKNGMGLWSGTGTSNGIAVAVPATIGQAKTTYTGQPVYITDSVVTSTASDYPGVWVESSNRSAGVKINSTGAFTRGQRIPLYGIVSWTDGVPMLGGVESGTPVSGAQLSSLGLTNSRLANDRYESLNYAGINPVGLLVTTWGRVTQIDTSNRVFYVDDGANLADGMGASGSPYTGLRVSYGTGFVPPAQGQYVKVTGIRTVVKVTLTAPTVVNGQSRDAGDVIYLPVVALRNQSDMVTMP